MALPRVFTLALPGVAALNYTVLPNTRCHNDVGQYHDVAQWSDCESVCLPSLLFTYCPNSSAADCGGAGEPQPQTCWCFPLSSLSTCEPAAGWTSGYAVVPPVPPPADWAPLIARGDMAFTSDPPELIGEGYYPVTANGFVGFETGPFTQPLVNTWPWRDAGSLKMAGVYSGHSWVDPSHRAQIPKLSDVTLLREPNATYAVVGTAIDYAAGIYYNRTHVVSAPQCVDTIIEMRTYAHRALRELFVFETRGSAVAPALWVGSTAVPEEAGLPLRMLAVAFDDWVAAGPTQLVFTAAAPLLSVRAVMRSDLDVAGATSPADVAVAAAATWSSYTAQGPAALLAGHEAAMAALWTSGVELAGNASFAATVNASLYDIISSLRADWNWSTSPGGIATGGYAGHSFWDMETWMFPVLVALFPDLARVAAQYRIDRVAASATNAALSGYDGAMWAWESAFTGLWTAPWRAADTNENHISADIPLAQRKLWYASGDRIFLAESWPLLNATCAFWACRFQRTDSVAPGPPAGYGPKCGPKDGSGPWTVKNVIPPDESSGVTSDSAYTNAAAAETLAWCLEAAGILGVPEASLPPVWAEMAAAPYLPLNDTLFAGGPVHMQNAGYDGHPINQADVALLQYPLGLDFGAAQNGRDLDYYASVTNFAGMFTGDSAYACAYLALGNRSSADAQLALAFNHIEPHFNVFHETAFDDGHTQHFITGSGGYVQSFVFGYSGMRIARLGVFTFSSQAPIVPPLGVTGVKLRGLHLLGVAFDFWFDDLQLCAQMQLPAGAVPLELRVVASGARTALSGDAPVCVPVQAVEVAGVGYA